MFALRHLTIREYIESYKFNFKEQQSVEGVVKEMVALLEKIEEKDITEITIRMKDGVEKFIDKEKQLGRIYCMILWFKRI